MKLTGNLFLLALTTGIADALMVAKAQGITNQDVLTLFNSWNPGAMAPARMKKMMEGDFSQPSWELDMARKDAGLMLAAAQAADMDLTVIPAIAAKMDSLIEKGHGQDDWSIIGKASLS
jgi:3-hydroxyisobutyrate dehydrogenase